MKFQNNKRYPIWRYFSLLYKDGSCYLVVDNEYVFSYGFKMIKILYRNDYCYKHSTIHGDAVLLMIYRDGLAGIYDLQHLKWIVEKFEYTGFRMIYSKEESHFEMAPQLKNDMIEVKSLENIFEIYTNSPYCLINYSLERGVILNLNKKPHFYEFGYLIDNHIIHDFSGKETDLDTLKLITDDTLYPVYYDNKNLCYLVLVDETNGGLLYLDSGLDHSNILSCYYEGTSYHPGFEIVFDTDTEEMQINSGSDYDYGWTEQQLRDGEDIAYEGYSRLELGLD